MRGDRQKLIVGQIGIISAERILDEAGDEVTGVKTKYYVTFKYFKVIFMDQGKDWNRQLVIQLKARIEKSFSDRYSQSIDLSEQPEAILQAEELFRPSTKTIVKFEYPS